jgi:hypothetical protein
MARKRKDSERSDAEHDDPLDSADDEQDADEADDDAAEDDAADGDESADEAVEDISDTPAPSVGPHTTFSKQSAEERLARHEQSDVDAMGLDKRREVIGGSYSPSIGRQAATYGIVLGVVAAIVVGFLLLANKLDQPEDKYEDQAPWSQAGAEQIPPPGIDFPEYGHPGPGESAEATP